MSGNAPNKNELGQCVELVCAIAKGMALVAPKMTPQARQSWIGMPPTELARVLEALIFLPANHNPANLIIDCDAQPFVPDGWSVEEHQKGGAFKWDKEAQKDALYVSKGQAGSKYIEGIKLRKELSDKGIPVLNANVLDYLLANPHLIPEEWKGKYVFFWGTVYRGRGGGLCVRYLCWCGGAWGCWGNGWLDGAWGGNGPAAVRAT